MDKKYFPFVKAAEEILSCSAHHMDHVLRVYEKATYLHQFYPSAQGDILYPAVILHDIGRVRESEDTTGQTDHALVGAEMAQEILEKAHYDEEHIEAIIHCIKAHRFRTGIKAQTIEAQILHDADKLDVLGAIGVARILMISGKYGQRLLLPEEEKDNTTQNGRIKNLAHHNPITEFKVKMLRIPERFYLPQSKEMAKHSFEFLKLFFETLERELKGDFNYGQV